MDRVQKINRDYYDKNALRWASIKTNPFFHKKQFKNFIRYFKSGDRIMDIGCAYGIHVPLFLGIGRKLRYEGIDISKEMIKLAKSRYPQLSFRVCDILAQKCLPKKKYGGFWAAAIFQHIPAKNWPQLLENIEASLKNGGIGYLTLPSNKPNTANQKDKRHFTLFDDKKFKKFIKPREWTILRSGKYKNINSTSGRQYYWLWYIVRVPVAEAKLPRG